jgi:hypothetical protein
MKGEGVISMLITGCCAGILVVRLVNYLIQSRDGHARRGEHKRFGRDRTVVPKRGADPRQCAQILLGCQCIKVIQRAREDKCRYFHHDIQTLVLPVYHEKRYPVA